MPCLGLPCAPLKYKFWCFYDTIHWFNLDTLKETEDTTPTLLQREKLSSFFQENTITGSEIQTNEELLQKCGSNGQDIDLIRSAKKSKLTKEKTYEKIDDDQNIFTNSSDIPQVVGNNQERSLTSKRETEGDQ